MAAAVTATWITMIWKSFAAVYTALCPVAMGTVLYQLTTKTNSFQQAYYKIVVAMTLTMSSHCILVLSEPTGDSIYCHYNHCSGGLLGILFKSCSGTKFSCNCSTRTTKTGNNGNMNNHFYYYCFIENSPRTKHCSHGWKGEKQQGHVIAIGIIASILLPCPFGILSCRQSNSQKWDQICIQPCNLHVSLLPLPLTFEDVLQHSAMEAVTSGTMKQLVECDQFTSILIHTAVENNLWHSLLVSIWIPIRPLPLWSSPTIFDSQVCLVGHVSNDFYELWCFESIHCIMMIVWLGMPLSNSLVRWNDWVIIPIYQAVGLSNLGIMGRWQ